MSARTAATARSDESAFDPDEPVHESPAASVRATDPVVRRLGLVAILIVALWLSGVVTALFTGVLTSEAPRTSVERALGVYEAEVAAGTMTAEKWADYINVLTAAGQYGKAQQTVETALAAFPDSASLIILEQARLHVARGEYDAAVTAAEDAITAARQEIEVVKAEAAKKGVPFTQERLEQEETAVLLTAEVYEEMGDSARAIEQYTTYLTYQPAAANIYVRRADVKAEVGDTEGAEADYREALRFVADDPAALAGLERIGAQAQ